MSSMTPIPYRGWVIVPKQITTAEWGVFWHLKQMGEHYNLGPFRTETEAVVFAREAVDREINPSP